MTNIEITEMLYGDFKNFKGTELVKELLETNPEFKSAVEIGLEKGLIQGFDAELFARMDALNLRETDEFSQVFRQGYNRGSCSTSSRYMSFIFRSCYIAGGVNKFLIGTTNSPDGSHTWIEDPQGNIYDTSFMMVIKPIYADSFGYSADGRADPEQNAYYRLEKEMVRADNPMKK